MRIVIIGANGMLGSDLHDILREKKKFEVIPFYGPVSESKEQNKEVIIDITNRLEIEEEIVKAKPDVIIHTAAYTNVDGCELNEEKAYLINSTGTKNVALAAKKSGSFLIYISTDYVFNGEKKSPYRENDQTNPTSVYGRTKLDGEKFVQDILDKWAVIRISWLFGKNGKNFIKAIINKINELRITDYGSRTLKVVNDQIGSPTYTKDLSKGISDFLLKGCETGIYHLTNQGFCSWFEFAKKIVELTGNAGKIKVEPITSSQLPRLAKRPQNSVLENYEWKSKSYPLLQKWENALKEYLSEEEESKLC